MIIMGQWTRVENSNEVLLRVTNHTGQAEKNLLGLAGIRTRDLRFTSADALPTELQVKLELVVNDGTWAIWYFETESSFFDI